MNRVALALSTRDKVEQVKRVAAPLLRGNFDLFWSDGSQTEKGQQLAFQYKNSFVGGVNSNVSGGADAVIAFNLTTMLQHSNNYTHVGLIEDDVLLTDPEWFSKTMALFEIDEDDDLKVGAVSARCYEDRILIQRDGYAVCHNLGAGMVIFTRQAAQLVLKHFRTGWTTANRLLFSQLSGLDIGAWWAFKGGQHVLGADWHFDTVLAAHGLASLALTPSLVEMIGQDPPLAEQGLTIAAEPVKARIDDFDFAFYCDQLLRIREKVLCPAWPGLFHAEGSGQVIFPHQIEYLGGSYRGDWELAWKQAWGPFAWRAGRYTEWQEAKYATDERFEECRLNIPVLGPCDILVSGGMEGGQVQVSDSQSGFIARPRLSPEGDSGQVLALTVPASCAYRKIELTALTPGVVFYGVRCREAQPYDPALSFDHSWLPKP